MKKAIVIFLLGMSAPILLQAQDQAEIPRDTSYTLYQTYEKVRKSMPDVRIADPGMPAGVVACNDVVYSTIPDSPYGERKLRADVYRPDDGGKYPALLMVHGGGWSSGDRTMQRPLAQQIAARGYVTIPVEYRLLPEAAYPAALHDLKEAVRWVRANGKKYGIDTSRIAISGCSSGAHLASLVGVTNGSLRHEGSGGNAGYSSAVQAVVNIDGVLSFVDEGNLTDINEGMAKLGGKPTKTVLWLGGLYEERPQVWEEASPALWVSERSAPMCFINCMYPRYSFGRDETIEKLGRYNIYTEKHLVEQYLHTFWLFYPWFDRVEEYTVDFLDRVFKNDSLQ